ncbi:MULTISPECIES: SDR family oxidoreductase [Actinosynnema]|uniref:SDR family NAD(P)-dependent oxidoreductase n=1 Tax=Actinosynnema TaxID=40566 RepID=UPI0020A436CC|nr:SDR family oxidoreductase [Actinosynnema pretiosum]MCP2097069.1 hypothetical protein [Actinosynnema pretiosum]
MTYRGTTALVTGASKGLGRALAEELAARGANLVLVARTDLSEFADHLRATARVDVRVIAADLTDRASRRAALAELGEQPIDLLVNNAGAGSVGPFLDTALPEQVDSIALNVEALTELTHHVARSMRAAGAGTIVNIGSVAGYRPVPYQATYAATKAYVRSFTEALRVELRGSGVRVVAVNPGAISTAFFEGKEVTIDARAADTPTKVARDVLDHLRAGRAVSVPGKAVNRVMVGLLTLLPVRAAARLMAVVNRALGFDRVGGVEKAG